MELLDRLSNLGFLVSASNGAWRTVFADLLIGVANLGIASTLLYLVWKRRHLKFHAGLFLIGIMVLTCGVARFVDLWTVAHPGLPFQGAIQFAIVILPLFNAIALICLIPKALQLPTIEQLRSENMERRRAEEELTIRDHQLRLSVETGLVGLWSRALPGGTLDWSHKCKEIFGIASQTTMTDAIFLAQVHPSDRHQIVSILDRIGRGYPQERYNSEYRTAPAEDGSYRWVSVKGTTFFDSQGAPTRILGTVLDITNQKTSDAAAAKQAERMKSVVDHVVDGIITINSDYLIESWNPAAKQIFGYETAEVLGKNVKMLMPEPYHGQHNRYVSNYLTTGDAKVIGIGREVTGLRKDGTTFPMDLAVSEFRMEGQPLFTGIVRDITDRRRAAEDLQAAKDLAEAANRTKSAFLANMSHEIRTPLGAVLGFSDLLSSPTVTPSDRFNYASAIKRNGELLSSIISDILDLSKVEADKMTVEIGDVGIDEVLIDMNSYLDLQAKDKGIHLSVYSAGLIPAVIRTDALRLRQVLLNIVGNAVKFTAKGSVDVTVRLLPLVDGKRLLEFAIKDSGIGMSTKQSATLFEPFSQADISTKRRFGGTGLGLLLAKRLANLLGGDVVLTASAEGRGSIFTATIDPGDLTGVELMPLGPRGTAPMHQPPIASSTAPADLSHVRVLLVDDSPDNQLLVRQHLKGIGIALDVAGNGREALEKVKVRAYDILLMDLQMPVMDGFECTRELRNLGFAKPIIALTAHALKEERQNCLNSGFTDHLSKPINRQILLERMTHYAPTETGHGQRI